MDIKDIHKLGIELGIKNDLRPKADVMKKLKRLKEKYEKLDKDEKKLFDKEQLTNPYSDSRVHYDSGVKKVKRVLTGIDMDTAELLLANTLNQQNPKKQIDLIIAHHPTGAALMGLDAVMDLQVDVLHQYGVPINIAESLVKKRISEVSRGLDPINHFKPVDAARLLGLGYMNVHTPADNMVATFLKRKMEKEKPEYVGDILKSLLKVPEYAEAKKLGGGPRLFTGTEDNRAGKIGITEITGGTEGSKDVYKNAAAAGIGTIIVMHQSEPHRKAAEEAHINVVSAGHISSDSIGMNLFLDELEKKGVEIVPCSGLIRHSRVK